MKYLIPILIIAGAYSSCHKKLKPSAVKVASGVPECIASMININKDNRDWEIGNIEEYKYQGKMVYALNPDLNIIADAAVTIQTSDCRQLCSIGGFRGQLASLCNGENFFRMRL